MSEKSYTVETCNANTHCIYVVFFLSSGRVDTAIWMHYVDAN